MKTPYLDDKIESLDWKVKSEWAVEHEKEQLKEYQAIKEALMHNVNQRYTIEKFLNSR